MNTQAEPLREPRVDWTAFEHLVDAAIRRGDITVGRGAEILGLRLRTWRERALEIRDEGNLFAEADEARQRVVDAAREALATFGQKPETLAAVTTWDRRRRRALAELHAALAALEAEEPG